MNYKVLIIDDHRVFSESLKTILEVQNFNTTSVTNAELGIKHIKSSEYDIIITDVEMPEMNGFELIKEIKSIEKTLKKSPKYIILTSFSKIRIFKQFYDLGIHAYLSKNVSQLELISVVKRVLNNETYFEKSIYDAYIKSDMSTKEIELTSREKDILQLILEEKTTQEIADILTISPFTVEGHRKNLMQKTNSKNVVGLIKYALINNLT